MKQTTEEAVGRLTRYALNNKPRPHIFKNGQWYALNAGLWKTQTHNCHLAAQHAKQLNLQQL